MIEIAINWIKRGSSICFGTVNHATATATVVIAIVTTTYAVVSGLELRAMNRANDINADNLYQIQRPFIFADHVDAQMDILGNVISSIDFNPAVQNAGNTPPKKVSVYMNYYTPKDPIAPDFKFPDMDDVSIVTGPAGPKNFIRVPTKNIPISALQEIRDGNRHFYIYGHIEYDDTFKNTSHHVTLYCFELESIRGAEFNTPGSVAINVPLCRRHNCTDNSCDDQQ